jgi:hypothetical protein
MTDQPDLPVAGLSTESAIHLRWVLRDIKSKRTKFLGISPDDLRTLTKMGLIEMGDEVPCSLMRVNVRSIGVEG